MTVADRIRDKRKELGLSQDDLARMMGYKDKTSISKIENSGNDISMKKLDKIAKVLDTTPEDLMGWSSKEQYERVRKYASYIRKAIDFDLEKATTLYNLYQNASPEAKKAVEVLLKFEPPQA